jgi:hypothetical protein
MRRIALALTLGLALGLGACNSDSTGPNGSVVGSYQLQRINGNTLPYTFPSGATITSEQFTLNSDGTYTDIANYSNASTYIERGSFSANGGAVQFIPDNVTIPTYQGSVSGSVLTIISQNSGYSSVYQKQ